MLCIHLRTKLLEQAQVKDVRFDVVNNFNDIILYEVSSGDIFCLASISLWMIQCIAAHSGTTSLIQAVKPDTHLVMAAATSVHMQTEKDYFSFPLI